MARERSLEEGQAVALFLYVTIALQAELRRTEQGLIVGIRQRGLRRRRLGLAEHFGRDVALGDLAQRDHGRLVVLPGNGRLGAIRQAARALRGQQDELEDVLDVREAVFDGDTGHVLLGCKHCWGWKVYWKIRPLAVDFRDWERPERGRRAFFSQADRRSAA